MKKLTTMLCMGALTLTLLAGCGKAATYQDGTYTGTSSEDDRGAYGEVTLTIENGEIADCKFVTWQADGSIKDENYGKVGGDAYNEEYYEKAQLAVAAMEQYAKDLKDTKTLDGVEAVSGATISYDQFCEAVEGALREAAAD